MNFVRAWSARPADAGETRTVAAHTGREAVVLQHSSFHTHVALSPVVTKLIREQYTLPVRELRFDRQTRLQLERVTSNSPANDTGSSRLVSLVQVVERVRPANARALKPAEDLQTASRRAHQSASEDAVDVIQAGVTVPPQRGTARMLKEDQDTLATAARELGLDPAALEVLQKRFLKPDANEFGIEPILSPEIETDPRVAAEIPRSVRRFVAKQRGPVASDAGDVAAQTETRGVSNRKRATAEANELVLSRGAAGAQFGFGTSRRAARDTAASDRESIRPLLEREPAAVGAEQPAKPSEAVQTAVVQEAVRRTLRALPEPDVEAFADRVSRTIERRLQIDRDWRGGL